MRYLITNPNFDPFLTDWFDYPDKYPDGSVVYDFAKNVYTEDGFTWKDLTLDHL